MYLICHQNNVLSFEIVNKLKARDKDLIGHTVGEKCYQFYMSNTMSPANKAVMKTILMVNNGR